MRRENATAEFFAALKQAVIAAAVAFGLFVLIVGIRTEQGPTGALVIATRFDTLAFLVGGVFVGSLLRSLVWPHAARVLAQGFPGAADWQAAEPQRHPVCQQRERKDQIIEKHDAVRRRVLQAERRGEAVLRTIERQAEEGRARNSGNAVRSAGETLPVEKDEADDFAEPERDDGEIVAAQTQHRKAQ